MPECGYCKDCKWWARNRLVFGSCEYARAGQRRLPGTGDWRQAKAFVEVRHPRASLITKADFGCAQWEAKDAQG